MVLTHAHNRRQTHDTTLPSLERIQKRWVCCNFTGEIRSTEIWLDAEESLAWRHLKGRYDKEGFWLPKQFMT